MLFKLVFTFLVVFWIWLAWRRRFRVSRQQQFQASNPLLPAEPKPTLNIQLQPRSELESWDEYVDYEEIKE